MKRFIVGIQMMFVAFGALVLVPLLTGLDPNVALLTAGCGTLIFHLVTKGKVPVFLASSFAYIAPIIAATKLYGLKGTLGGLMAAGIVKMLFSLLIKYKGIGFINRILPSHVIGPVIIVIGLSLAPVAVNMAKDCYVLAMIALVTTIIVSHFCKGFLKLTPILAGILTGYIAALLMGKVDFAPIVNASWFSMPNVTFPSFNWEAIVYIVPVALAPAIEHIGDIMVISDVAGKKFYKDPGLHRTILGDGLATSFASLLGGPPNTTYSEVTGAVALTKIYDPFVMRVAAVTAIIMAFIGKLGAFLKTIPGPVMGGIMIILFGMIASIGIKNMVQHKVDMSSTKNMIVVSLILVIGIGGAVFSIGHFSLAGIGLSGVVGVLVNLLLPERKGADA